MVGAQRNVKAGTQVIFESESVDLKIDRLTSPVGCDWHNTKLVIFTRCRRDVEDHGAGSATNRAFNDFDGVGFADYAGFKTVVRTEDENVNGADNRGRSRARGALGHWIEIKDSKIANYQCVVPSTWNFSPSDDSGQPGPVEQALIGTKIKDENNPFEIGRIVRSMDPCLACAIHLITPKWKDLGTFKVC